MFEIDVDIVKLLWAITNKDDRKAALREFLESKDAYTGTDSKQTNVPCAWPGCDKMKAQGKRLYCEYHSLNQYRLAERKYPMKREAEAPPPKPIEKTLSEFLE